MHKLALILVSFVALVPSTARADKDFADGAGATYNCDEDGTVNIRHNGGTYVLTGECRQVNIEGSDVHLTIADVDQLSITGSGNVVKVGALESLLVYGDHNSVHWSRAKSGDHPTLAVVGSGNAVARSN